MADPNTCLANARQIDPQAVLCVDWICEQQRRPDGSVYKFCHCQPPYPPQNPCPYGANSPVAVYQSTGLCWCCCSCYAYGMPVAAPGDPDKKVETYVRGDLLLAGNADLTFSPATVEFSDGVPPGTGTSRQVLTVYFTLPGGREEFLIVTPDHVFMVQSAEGRKVRRANVLSPGIDRLVLQDGQTAEILGIELGAWDGGLHHVATTYDAAESIDGHLIISKQVVCGDWALQVSTIPDLLDVKPRAALFAARAPAATPQVVHEGFQTRHAKVAADRIEKLRPKGFRRYAHGPADVPEDAKSFFTKQQAEDILKNATQVPITNTGSQINIFYLFQLMRGFYPSINFALRWEDFTPNAWSYRQYGVDFVVLSGGLARTEGVGGEALALVLGHEIGHLYGGAPLVPDTAYSCEGVADYAALSAVLYSIYQPRTYLQVVPEALRQIDVLFDYIDPAHRGGKPGSTCQDIGVECRKMAMRAGMQFAPLPACAGGPAQPFLVAKSAIASKRGKDTAVTVTFNLPLRGPTATRKANYRLGPKGTIEGAEWDAGAAEKVELITDLAVGAKAQMTIKNVLAEDGSLLDGGKVTLPITWA